MKRLLIFLIFSIQSMIILYAKPYAVITEIKPIGQDCLWIEVSVFDDNNTPANPRDDIFIGSGGTFVCGVSYRLSSFDENNPAIDEMVEIITPVDESETDKQLAYQEFFEQHPVNVYPNPVKSGDYINLEYDPALVPISYAKVYDMQGREVLNVTNIQNRFKIPENLFGAYFMVIFYTSDHKILHIKKITVN